MEAYETYDAILRSGNRPLYQLAVLASMVLGAGLIHHDSKTWPLSLAVRIKIIAGVAVGCLVGCALPAFFARGYVGFVASNSLLTPKTILGGLLIGFFAAALVKRTMGVSYDTSDAFARGGCLMMVVGRLGCMAQHCCFGRPTDSWIGIDLGDGVARLPVQAIEASLVFLLFAGLHFCHTRRYFENRRLFILFAAYGILRCGLEFLREDIASRWLGLGFYQWLSLGLLAVGLFQIVVRTAKRRPQATRMLGATEVST